MKTHAVRLYGQIEIRLTEFGLLPPQDDEILARTGERKTDRYFVMPKPYSYDAVSAKEMGFVRCIIPQHELELALSDATRYIGYDGRVSSSKTVDEKFNYVYPHDGA